MNQPFSILAKIRYVPFKLENVLFSTRDSLDITPSMELQGKSVPLKKLKGKTLNGFSASMSYLNRKMDPYLTCDLPPL